MTKNDFLDSMKAFTEDAVKDLLLPVSIQEEGEIPTVRPAEVYRMRLPDSNSATKKVPYIIHQIVTTQDTQSEGRRTESTVLLRSIFCVFSRNEEEGALMLLELTDRFRVALMRKRIIADRYALDLKTPMETMFYTDNIAPYFAGEMMSTWKVPTVEREVAELWQ